MTYEQRDLNWRGLKLYHGRRFMAEVVPDDTHVGTWRVKIGNGLSDMVNLSRAKDAACCLTVSRLNSVGPESVGSPRMAISGKAA